MTWSGGRTRGNGAVVLVVALVLALVGPLFAVTPANAQEATRARVADFDGDGDTDVAVFRPSSGMWHVLGADPVLFGQQPGDLPLPADYDGDGITDVAIFRSGMWLVRGAEPVSYGSQPGDVPLPADYDGDGDDDVAVFRSGLWFVRGQGDPVSYGSQPGDVPLPADYDGDGDDDFAVFRSGMWFVRGQQPVRFGSQPGDVPLPGDYDGDGTADLAVFRPSTGMWFVRGQEPVVYGSQSGDLPMPGDYDGDGAVDIAIFRSGTWLVRGAAAPVVYGTQPGDVALPLHHVIRDRYFSTPTPAPAVVARINAGGPAVTTGGVSWSADQFFSGGKSYTNPSVTDIAGTPDDVLYTSEHSATSNLGTFGYAIPVPASGTYTVRLHFAEIYWGATGGGAGGAGQRVFSANVEGGAVELADYDINAEVGAMAASVKTYTATVTDGMLDIAFSASVNQPKVSAIEVLGGAGGDDDPDPEPPGEATFTQVSWSTVAASPIARHEAFGGFASDGKLYVFGGYYGAPDYTPSRRADVYDPVADTWTRLPDLPIGLSHAGLAVDGMDLYFAGGYPEQADGTGQSFSINKVWRFDATTRTYSELPTLPAARGGGALALLGRTLHFYGGADSSRKDATSHWTLSLDGGAGWVARANLPTPRNHLGSAALNGKVYAVAGQSGQDAAATYRTDVHAYDPVGDSWSAVAGLPRALSHNNASTFVMDGRIVVIGGEIAYGSSTAAVSAYSPAAGAWSALTPLPSARNAGVGGHTGGALFHATGSSSRTTYRGAPAVGMATTGMAETDMTLLAAFLRPDPRARLVASLLVVALALAAWGPGTARTGGGRTKRASRGRRRRVPRPLDAPTVS